ncbi:hypothetical protein NVP1033O_84 [Vibrio phage 1.033.O._10N.222.49.B8]|nr:hypothetical protein NVP1033O_84 [Vibrio phage 1.033.O._10N.222.49.B8]
MFKVLVVETDKGAYFTTKPCVIASPKRISLVNTNLAHVNQLENPAPVHEIRGYGPILPDTYDHWASFDALVRMLSLSETSIEHRFMKDKTYQSSGAKISLEEVWQRYCEYARQNNASPMAKKSFGKYLTNVAGHPRKQTTYQGNNVTCVINLQLID